MKKLTLAGVALSILLPTLIHVNIVVIISYDLQECVALDAPRFDKPKRPLEKLSVE